MCRGYSQERKSEYHFEHASFDQWSRVLQFNRWGNRHGGVLKFFSRSCRSYEYGNSSSSDRGWRHNCHGQFGRTPLRWR